jgi:hypothetical protein
MKRNSNLTHEVSAVLFSWCSEKLRVEMCLLCYEVEFTCNTVGFQDAGKRKNDRAENLSHSMLHNDIGRSEEILNNGTGQTENTSELGRPGFTPLNKKIAFGM